MIEPEEGRKESTDGKIVRLMKNSPVGKSRNLRLGPAQIFAEEKEGKREIPSKGNPTFAKGYFSKFLRVGQGQGGEGKRPQWI